MSDEIEQARKRVARAASNNTDQIRIWLELSKVSTILQEMITKARYTCLTRYSRKSGMKHELRKPDNSIYSIRA